MSDEVVHDVSLSSPQVVQQTGITYRELDHWARKGHISPRLIPGQGKRRHPDRDPNTPGSGHSRRWMPEEVAIIGTMVRLSRAGIPPALASRIARGETEIGPGITVTVTAPRLGQPVRPLGEPSRLPLSETLGLREGDAADTQLRDDLDAIRRAEADAMAALDAPWWLVREAAASTALDRDETCGTYSLPEEKP